MTGTLKSIVLSVAASILVIAAYYFIVVKKKQMLLRKFSAEYVFSVDNEADKHEAAQTLAVIKNRFRKDKRYSFSLDKKGNNILKGNDLTDTIHISRLLTTNAGLMLSGLYRIHEIGNALQKADEKLAEKYAYKLPPPVTDTVGLHVPDVNDSTFFYEHPILSVVQIPEVNSSTTIPAIIGHVAIKDTSALNRSLSDKSILSYFPDQCGFRYGLTNELSEYIQLYAVKTKPQDVLLVEDGNMLSAYQDYDGINDRPVLLIEFTKEAAKKWERLTRENVNKPIGILVDNVIITAPFVNEPIPGGHLSITGWSVAECFLYANIFENGRLESRVNILERKVEVMPLRPPYLHYLLLIMVCFAMVFGLRAVFAWIAKP